MGPLVIVEGCGVSLQRHHRLVLDSVEADGEQASPIVVGDEDRRDLAMTFDSGLEAR